MKTHYDAEAHFGRPRTACGATAMRTKEHAKVTCSQCRCTKVFKNGPRMHVERCVDPESREQRDAAIGAFHELDGLIDLASRWLNNSTMWEQDEYLAPKFQELRDRVAALTKGPAR